MTCSEPGCDRPTRARGYCKKHYQQRRRGCPAGCWISRVTDSVAAIDESTLRDLFDADLGWCQRIEGSDEMAHVAVASNPPEALFRLQ